MIDTRKPLCTLRMTPYPNGELCLQSEDQSVRIRLFHLPTGEYEVASIEVKGSLFQSEEVA